MDDKDHDDKSLIEKTLDAVKEIATSARDAAKHAMEPEPVKPGDQVVLIPIAGDGFADSLMSPMPMMPVVIPKKKRMAPAKLASAKIAPAPKKAAAAKKANKKSSKKAAKKAAKKTAKKTKSSAARKAKKKKA